MNKFSSKNFFNDDFFTDDFVYTTSNNETYTVKVIVNRFWENNIGGVQNKNVADWMDLAIQSSDIGFIPKVHETLTDTSYTYSIKQIREDGDTYMLSCEKSRRTIK
jgi:hypothetical protein